MRSIGIRCRACGLTMCNKEQLIGYLYDELGAAERTTFEAHLASCAACRTEVAGLRRTREHLTRWAPPDPEFEFHIVRGAAAPPPPARRWFGFVPQWAMAAAASVLVLAGAAAIAHVELRYGPDGFVVRTGWASAAPAPVSGGTQVPSQAAATGVSSEQLNAVVQVFEKRLLELERAQSTQTVKASATMQAAITAPELRRSWPRPRRGSGKRWPFRSRRSGRTSAPRGSPTSLDCRTSLAVLRV